MKTDEELILAFRRGDRSACEELFLRYRDLLYRFFRRRGCDSPTSEELIQETFIGLIRAVVRYEARATFRAYLYGIAFRQLRAAHARTKRTAAQPLSSTEEPAAAANTLSAIWVRDALNTLDADDREIVMLREFEALSYSEISRALSIPINTVRSRLFRARMALKEILNPTVVDPLAMDRSRYDDKSRG